MSEEGGEPACWLHEVGADWLADTDDDSADADDAARSGGD